MELLKLRSATTAYLAILSDLDTWAEQVADVNRVVVPEYAGLLDRLRDEIKVALQTREQGTPATMAAVAAELLGLA